MRLILCGRGVVLTPAFKALVERKVTKLARLRPHVLDTRVTCAAEKFRRTVRLTMRARRRTFSAVATAGDLVAAVDAAVDLLARQVSEEKRRRRARPHGPSRVA